MNQLLVILGPTSTGKTDLALQLAKKFNGEIVSCDSRQVYTGLDIGTGKFPGQFRSLKTENKRWLVDNIPIYLYDVVNPKKQYTVYGYMKDAKEVINKIQTKGKLPIVVGGTGLYFRALLDGMSNLGIPINPNLRKELGQLSLQELQKRLQQLSNQKWQEMNNSDRKNPRRLIRAIELAVWSLRGVPLKAGRRGNLLRISKTASLIARSEVLKVGLTASRDVLYKRIDERVVTRVNKGMINEAESLHKNGLSLKRMRQLGLEYGVLADYLEKKITKDGLIKILQKKIHDYAKRQLTWFKKEQDVFWFDITEKTYLVELEKMAAKWYHSFDAA